MNKILLNFHLQLHITKLTLKKMDRLNEHVPKTPCYCKDLPEIFIRLSFIAGMDGFFQVRFNVISTNYNILLWFIRLTRDYMGCSFPLLSCGSGLRNFQYSS